MESKNENIVVITIIIIIIAITTSVITWLVATKLQMSEKITNLTTQNESTVEICNNDPQQIADLTALDESMKDILDEPEQIANPIAQPMPQLASPAEIPISESKDFPWKLISGKDDTDSCEFKVWGGSTTIKGWYVWENNYAGEQWMLRVLDSDIEKLPKPNAVRDLITFHQTVRLIDASPELEKELKAATRDNPKEITLKGYQLYCEGQAIVSIAPATESFNDRLPE